MIRFESYYKRRKKLLEKALRKYMDSNCPSLLSSAIRYSLFPGGKRFRPLLFLATAEMLGMKVKEILPVACGIELIHNYSLIHDDLPAIDNDDYRRGKLTVHKRFNEGIAILTGDALLIKAFDLISMCENEKTREVISLISKAIGPEGMVGGQILDTFASDSLKKRKIRYIHLNKTAKLIEVAVESAAILASAESADRVALKRYARNLGLAFQIADEIKDINEDEGKITYPNIFGKRKSCKELKKLLDKSKSALSRFNDKANILRSFADLVGKDVC